jgi:transcriptional regulator with XRE-family HTH domain
MRSSHATTTRGIAGRIREIRIERYGTRGEASLAAELGLPAQTWRNYESGVTIPGPQLLAFIELTGTNPVWLLRGSGERYLAPESPGVNSR